MFGSKRVPDLLQETVYKAMVDDRPDTASPYIHILEKPRHCCPEDVRARFWPQIEEQLYTRKTAALDELRKLAQCFYPYSILFNIY